MTTDRGAVHYEQRGTTAFITFDRTSARNAVTWEMYEQLEQALDRIESEKDLRVAVLRGAGGQFIAGTDIAQFASFKESAEGVAYERRLDAIVLKLESARVATIAAVQGYCVGGGLALATACDVRVATPDARFGMPIAKTVGNCLSLANYQRLVANLGVARTKQLLFLADFISAEEARTLGFVASVVEPDAFGAHIDELCAKIASYAPITLQVTKESITRIVQWSNARTLAPPNTDDLIRRAYGSRDFKEGVAAFVQKRPPKWEGR